MRLTSKHEKILYTVHSFLNNGGGHNYPLLIIISPDPIIREKVFDIVHSLLLLSTEIVTHTCSWSPNLRFIRYWGVLVVLFLKSAASLTFRTTHQASKSEKLYWGFIKAIPVCVKWKNNSRTICTFSTLTKKFFMQSIFNCCMINIYSFFTPFNPKSYFYTNMEWKIYFYDW